MISFEQVFHISTRKRKSNSSTEEDITVKLIVQFNITVHKAKTQIAELALLCLYALKQLFLYLKVIVPFPTFSIFPLCFTSFSPCIFFQKI